MREWLAHLLAIVLWGWLFVYALHGALAGDLYVVGRSGHGTHYSGLSAWLLVPVPILFYLAVAVWTQSLAKALREGPRRLVVIGVVLFSLLLMWLGMYLGSPSR